MYRAKKLQQAHNQKERDYRNIKILQSRAIQIASVITNYFSSSNICVEG